MNKQTQAFLNLFIAIIEENGYYDNIRKFAKLKGLNYEQLSKELYKGWWYNAPEGISVYNFLDSIEDSLPEMGRTNFDEYDIQDVIEFIYRHGGNWKD